MVTLHGAVGDETVDQARDAAPAEEHLIGQLVHPEAVIRGTREHEQGVVLRERDVVFAPQLLVEDPLQPGVDDEEVPPRCESRVACRDRAVGRGDRRHGRIIPDR